jgi:hypothetical protein
LSCGGLAINCYVDPVYTLDADLIVRNQIKAQCPGSDLRIQFTPDERYKAFLARSVETEVLGTRVRVACLEEVTQGKSWASSDSGRRLSQRRKDELDLIHLAEAYPALKASHPPELRQQLGND